MSLDSRARLQTGNAHRETRGSDQGNRGVIAAPAIVILAEGEVVA
jgi:hypothetical protein